MQNKSEISVMVFLCVHKVAESALIAVMLAAAGLAVLRAEGRGKNPRIPILIHSNLTKFIPGKSRRGKEIVPAREKRPAEDGGN